MKIFKQFFSGKRDCGKLSLLLNVIVTLFIKGGGMIIGIISMPLYMRYFSDNAVLGVWFTVLNVLNWVLNFDLGIGNGLRNHLTVALNNQDTRKAKRLVSSAYLLLGGVTLILCVLFCVLSIFVDWNTFFNISTESISSDVLRRCINISMLGMLISFWSRIIMYILYAMQKAAMTNLLTFITNLLLVLYLLLVKPVGVVDVDFERLSIVYAFALNIPLVFATIWVFSQKLMKDVRPNIRHYCHDSAKAVLSLGIVFLLIQLLYMAIATTNEWFISQFYAPEFCVEYQIYNKVFTMFGSLFMIAMIPLWSAVTKAYAEKDHAWIVKLRRILNMAFVGYVVLQIALIPFLTTLFDIWLGEDAPAINYATIWHFIVYGVIFTWTAIQSTFASGFGKLKVQLITYVLAVLIKVVGICLFAPLVENWTFVVLMTIVGLLPFSILQPIATNRQIQDMINV